jgi:hypothetical protein
MVVYNDLKKYIDENKTAEGSIKGSYIGLKRIAIGFCVYAAHPGEFHKVNIEKRLLNAGILNQGNSLDILVSCIYDDSKISAEEYSAKVNHLNGVVWHYIPNKSIENHGFLKQLFEKKGSADTYTLSHTQHINELGVDETEKNETFSRGLDEREAFKEGKDLDNPEHSEEFYENDDDEEFE